MGWIIIITVLFISALCGCIVLSKRTDWGAILFVPLIYVAIFCYSFTIAPLCGHSNELNEFNQLIEKTEYLISTYDVDKDSDGSIFLGIRNNIIVINNQIEKNKKLCKSFFFRKGYGIEEIANTEPIIFDLNNLLKKETYE